MEDELLMELLDLDADASEVSKSPTAGSVTLYQQRKYKRNHEICSLQRNIDALEALRDSLQRKNHAQSIQQMTEGTANNMWMNIALRQHRRLQAAQRENEQLHAQVDEQTAIVQRLSDLVLEAENRLRVPREFPMEYSSLDNISVVEQLTKLTSSMLSIVDTIFVEEAAPTESQKLTMCQRDIRDIAMDSMIASMVASRFLPKSQDGTSDCIWNCRASYPPGSIRLQLVHQEQDERSQRVYYQLHFSTDEGVFLFYAIGVGRRSREDSCTVHAFSSATWPDTKTPPPWNAISFLMRDWTLIQPLARVDAQQVRSCSQSFRYAHPFAPTTLASEEALALQDFVVQTHQRLLSNKNDCIDDFLVDQTSATV